MAITVTSSLNQVQAASVGMRGGLGIITGSFTTSGTYASGGFSLDLSGYFTSLEGVFLDQVDGYLLEYDETNKKVKVKVPNKPSQTSEQINIMDDDSASSNGTNVYVAVDRGQTLEAKLWSEMANSSTVYVQTESGNIKFPVMHRLVEEATVKVVDDDSAASNGTALYAVLTGEITPWGADIAILQSANANNSDSDFDTANPTDTFDVFDNDNAATAGPGGTNMALAIHFDDDGTTVDERFLVNNTITGNDVYVRSESGRYWQLKHDSSATSNGTDVYFDDDATTETDRLLSVTANNSNVTDSTLGNQDGIWNVDGVWLGQLYCDDDASDTEKRLLCNLAPAVDTFVVTTGERLVRIGHDASANSNGNMVYIDDDAGNADERLLSVTAGDANTTVDLATDYQLYGGSEESSAGEIEAGTTLALNSCQFLAIGQK